MLEMEEHGMEMLDDASVLDGAQAATSVTALFYDSSAAGIGHKNSPTATTLRA